MAMLAGYFPASIGQVSVILFFVGRSAQTAIQSHDQSKATVYQ